MGGATVGDGEGREEEKEGDRHPPQVRSPVPSNFSAMVAPMGHVSCQVSGFTFDSFRQQAIYENLFIWRPNRLVTLLNL